MLNASPTRQLGCYGRKKNHKCAPVILLSVDSTIGHCGDAYILYMMLQVLPSNCYTGRFVTWNPSNPPRGAAHTLC